MRTGTWVALALLAAVIVCGMAAAGVTERIAGEYTGTAEELTALCQKEDWLRASAVLEARSRSWRQAVEGLQMLVNHEDTDAVTMALETIRAGIDVRDRATAVLGCRQLREAADHIHHRDAFSWGNIL